MNKKQLILGWAILIFIVLTNSGCALIKTALNAAIVYGIYEATK